MALARPLRFDDSGWLIGATRRPGPANKQSGTRPRTTGMVAHSMEGWYEGSMAVLFGPREASWTGSIMQDGYIEQHYPFLTWCWHAKGGNSWTPGWEFEGRTGIPLTKPQLLIGDELYDAAQNLMLRKRYTGWEHWREHRRAAPYKNLFEHNEIPTSSTACPSERMIPLWPLVIAPPTGEPEPVPPEEDTLSSSEFDQIMKALGLTNRLLKGVGGLAVENKNMTVQLASQNRFIAESLVKHHKNEDMHDGVSDDAEIDPKVLEAINDNFEEIEARMNAASDALQVDLKEVV